MLPKYRYIIPVSNHFITKGQKETYMEELSYRVGKSFYNPSSKKDVIFDSLTLEGNSLILDLYSSKFGLRGRHIGVKNLPPNDLDNFFDKAFSYINKRTGMPDAMARDGEANYIGALHETPDTLYHITNRENLDAILSDGLLPKKGINNFSNGTPQVCLMDFDNIAPWLGILNVKEPVILEMKSKDIPGLETGRVYHDREYTDAYGEWKTLKAIPAECIKKAGFSKEQCNALFYQSLSQARTMQEKIVPGSMVSSNDYEESWNCLQRLWPASVMENLGVMNAAKRDPIAFCCNDLGLKPLAEKSRAVEKGEGKVKPKPVTVLADMQQKEFYKGLEHVDNRELCEMIRAHFESHPTLPGEKQMKDEANMLLKMHPKGEIPLNWASSIMLKTDYAETRIRQIGFKESAGAEGLKTEPIPVDGTFMRRGISVERADARLVKQEDGSVFVLGKMKDGEFRPVGTMTEKSLTNNPMNVDVCDAQLQIADYSGGKGNYVTMKLVVDTDEMSGDAVKLEDSMLSGIEDGMPFL